MNLKNIALILSSQLTLNSIANKQYHVNDKILNILNIKKQENLLNQVEDDKSIHFYDVMKNAEINNKVKEIHKNSKNKETFNEENLFILILIIILTISTLCEICRDTDDENKKKNEIDATDTNEKCENNKFSLNRLDDLINAGKKYEGLLYLQNFLEEIGTGFSRIVFQYGTNQVIKYDCNPKNYVPSQNSVELDCFSKLKSPILPIIYKNGKNNVYLVCERVEKAQECDFEKVLKVPFGGNETDFGGNAGEFKSDYPERVTVKKFIHFMEKYYYSKKTKNNIGPYLGLSLDDLVRYNERKETPKDNVETKVEEEDYKKLAIENPRFKELAKYIEYVISTYDIDYCDLRIENFGVVIRNGEPSICILDSGRSGPI